MSIDRSDYIVYGWKLPFKLKKSTGEEVDLWEDKFLPMIEGHKGEKFTIIRDGMSGKYTVFGLSIKSEHSGNGWDFENLYFKELNSEIVKSKYVELFESDPTSEPTLFIFTHYN